MRLHAALLALLLPAACMQASSEPASEALANKGAGDKDQGKLVDHTCKLDTLPPATTCGVPPAELPCCAVKVDEGQEQIDCCPKMHGFVHRICALEAPKCPSGGVYPSCAGLVCPPLSAPCTDGPGCCNSCGQIGPRGCSICDDGPVTFDTVCTTAGKPHSDLCKGVYDADGKSHHVNIHGAGDDEEDDD